MDSVNTSSVFNASIGTKAVLSFVDTKLEDHSQVKLTTKRTKSVSDYTDIKQKKKKSLKRQITERNTPNITIDISRNSVNKSAEL